MATLGIIPVFVHAGAVLLPVLVAALTSLLGLLCRPRELLAVCRRRPIAPLVVVLVVVFVVAAGTVFSALGRGAERSAPAPSRARRASVDWAQIALDLMERERSGEPSSAGDAEPELEADPRPRDLYYRGGPQRTGHLGGPSPLGLALLWRHREDDAAFLSSPMVAGDAVYAASCHFGAPTTRGSIVCIDARTGATRWVTSERADGRPFYGFFSSPAISADGESLVIGQGLHLDIGSELICLEARTGRVRWTSPTPLHLEGSPAIEGDIAVIGAGAIERGPNQRPRGDPDGLGHPGFVFAVRISDGKRLWRYRVPDPESSPIIVDGIAYIGSGVHGNAVLALRIEPLADLEAKGLKRLVWKRSMPYPAHGCIALHRDAVLAGCGEGNFAYSEDIPRGAVLAFDRESGAELWRREMPDTVLNAPAVRDGVAIVPVRNGEVFALDLEARGEILWRTRLHDDAAILAAPAFTGTHVYAVSQDGYLGVLDARDGAVLELHSLNARGRPGERGFSMSAPIIAGGRLHVGSETGGLLAFRTRRRE